MVRSVQTFYCETCGAAYQSYEDAAACEQATQGSIEPGGVILRHAPYSDEFVTERSALRWGIVRDVRTVPGGVHGIHEHWYSTSNVNGEISFDQIHLIQNGQFAVERDLFDGPTHTRRLSDLFETFADIRTQMAAVFEVISSCSDEFDLTPEMYVAWDDLRYTVYDFGVIEGDNALQIPENVLPLLQWAVQPAPVAEVHRRLFSKSSHGLRRGAEVYAPFDDTVGERSKWLIGHGDPYQYLRFHLQTRPRQHSELEHLQSGIFQHGDGVFDSLEYLFDVNRQPNEMTEAVYAWAREHQVHGSSTEVAQKVWEWMLGQEKRWQVPVNQISRVVPQHIPVVAVAAGKGGVGKSTISAHLARYLAKTGRRPLYLDLDFYGPSAPTEFGMNDSVQIRDGFVQPYVVDGVSIVSIGNMIPHDEALHWRGPVLEAFIHLLTAHIDYQGIDVIVLDCPPGTGDVQLGMYQRLAPGFTVLVTTGSELAIADVRRAISSIRKHGLAVTGVLENMSQISMGNGQYRRLFGESDTVPRFCEEHQVSFLGRVRFADTGAELQADCNTVFETLVEQIFKSVNE